eukprot:UN00036
MITIITIKPINSSKQTIIAASPVLNQQHNSHFIVNSSTNNNSNNPTPSSTPLSTHYSLYNEKSQLGQILAMRNTHLNLTLANSNTTNNNNNTTQLTITNSNQTTIYHNNNSNNNTAFLPDNLNSTNSNTTQQGFGGGYFEPLQSVRLYHFTIQNNPTVNNDNNQQISKIANNTTNNNNTLPIICATPAMRTPAMNIHQFINSNTNYNNNPSQ